MDIPKPFVDTRAENCTRTTKAEAAHFDVASSPKRAEIDLFKKELTARIARLRPGVAVFMFSVIWISDI